MSCSTGDTSLCDFYVMTLLNTYLSFHYFWYLLVLVEFHHQNSCLTILLGFFQSQLHSLLNLHLHWHHNFLLLLVSCLIREYSKCEINYNFQKEFINVNKYETMYIFSSHHPRFYIVILKVSKFQKQIFLFSFEPKNERN